jgi:Xaa-Pro aminopeptidase
LDLEPLPADFDRLRWQLSPDEIERYRRVCADVAESVESAARSAVPGATEAELAGRLAMELRSRSCAAWVLLVGCDQRIALHRHPLPTGKRLQRYAMLVTTAERGGLLAAVSRLVAFGRIPAELARRHQAVVTVDAALIAATRPEATLGEIFDVARRAYAEVGFPDQWRHHHQGGSIGYLPREVKAGPDCPVRALDRQAFAWNPSIAGTKSEDTILCRPGGCEVLTHTGQWPCVTGTWQGRSFPRPDILVL